jgi:hypothetical protein
MESMNRVKLPRLHKFLFYSFQLRTLYWVQFSRYAFFQSFVIKTTPAGYILKLNKNVTCMQELNTNVEKNIDSLISVLRQSVLTICKTSTIKNWIIKRQVILPVRSRQLYFSLVAG